MSAKPFQAVPLVCSPSYPNSIAWSEENLIAVATGPIVTILNPEKPSNPRGVITLTPGQLFPIGVIDKEDLVSDCMLTISLGRDTDPMVRSMAWSPIGFSPNFGCFLAVCSTDGRVKIYRQPYCEFQDEWIEVVDVSEMLLAYFRKTNFGESSFHVSNQQSVSSTQHLAVGLPAGEIVSSKKKRKRRRNTEAGEDIGPFHEKQSDTDAVVVHASATTEIAVFPLSSIRQGSMVEVFKVEKGQRVWVAGRVEHLDGSKACVLYSEAYTDGKEEWVEMDQRKSRKSKSESGGDENENFPSLRPSMDVGNLPKEIMSADCQGADEILVVGRAVEARTLDRWLEGHFVGFSNGGLLVKPHCDDDVVVLDASHVRLAPLWVKKKRLWQIEVVRLQRKEFVENYDSKCGSVTDNELQIIPSPKILEKPSECMPEDLTYQLITADVYASRNASLSSLVVAWSPTLHFSASSSDSSCNGYSLLAVGSKSGNVSILRISAPQQYSIGHGSSPPHIALVGLFQAHSSWVTTLSWGVSVPDASNHKLLLATGSSDGSVKIWKGCAKDLQESAEANSAPLSLLQEVSAVGYSPVTLVCITVPERSPRKVLLAIGRGSGSSEVWASSIDVEALKKIGSCDADNHAITGLAWAFDGCCMLTCSQDNSVRGYRLHKSSLIEVPFPSNNLCSRSSIDIPSVFDLCFGLAVSPGNLMAAVVRNFDRHTLDPMYQARIQRASVEFLWIGAQQLSNSSIVEFDFDVKAFPGFSEMELASWQLNILCSVQKFEGNDTHQVLWDVITASLAFKLLGTMFVVRLLSQWLPQLFKGPLDVPFEIDTSDLCKSLSNLSSRQLHLLNVFCRRVMLSGCSRDKLNTELVEPIPSNEDNNEVAWMKLLECSEGELRERLVGFSLAAVSGSLSPSVPSSLEEGLWTPEGVPQMIQWVNLGSGRIRDQVHSLASEVSKLVFRPTKDETEGCSYCSAPVLFESPEVAFCEGTPHNGGTSSQRHKMARCAASMKVCPATTTWFCVCCERWVSKLAPYQLYVMSSFPRDFMSLVKSLDGSSLFSKPLCPFCGILLQRKQPGFLLSVSPV